MFNPTIKGFKNFFNNKLNIWYDTALNSDWKTPNDVKMTYANANIHEWAGNNPGRLDEIVAGTTSSKKGCCRLKE